MRFDCLIFNTVKLVKPDYQNFRAANISVQVSLVKMNDVEKDGSAKILRLLSNSAVMSLFRTVTGGKILQESVGDVYRAILAFTLGPVELLRRRKVSRDCLFQYCYQEGIKVSGKADKPTLIKAILQHWGSDAVQAEDLLPCLERRDDNPEDAEKCSPNGNETRVESRNEIVRGTELYGQGDTEVKDVHAYEMALAFASWFYAILNEHKHKTPNEWGPQHFFSDCRMKLLVAGEDSRVDRYEGDHLIARRLSALVCEEDLYFCPNLEKNGTQGQTESHGLCNILVCGTVHHASMAVGLFEQQFGLIRDPTVDENWKIKFTNLKLKVVTPAQLTNNNMLQISHR